MISSIVGTLVYQLGYLSLLVHKKCSKPAMNKAQNSTIWALINGVRPKVIKLQLFPFSLRDVVATWFDSFPVGSMNTWEELVEAYMSKFFPPALAVEKRG